MTPAASAIVPKKLRYVSEGGSGLEDTSKE
jgi:hypothetical protein